MLGLFETVFMKGKVSKFCGRSIQTRKRCCIPGVKLVEDNAGIDAVTAQAKTDSLYIIHVGKNDMNYAGRGPTGQISVCDSLIQGKVQPHHCVLDSPSNQHLCRYS